MEIQSVDEMYHFLGILLKMFLISLDVNGFQSLWYLHTQVTLSPTFQLKIKDYPSWTQQYISYSRFVQIHAAFHPESRYKAEEDKCHQLRIAITHFNKAAMHTFIPGRELSFDEDSIPSKSTTTQSDNTITANLIRIEWTCTFMWKHLHIDMYQVSGKRWNNTSIPHDLWYLPTTHNVVLMGICKDPNAFQ